MKKYTPFPLILLAPLALMWLLVACEKEEPQPWYWTYQDSLDVMELLEPQGEFLSSAGHLPDDEVEVTIPEDVLQAVRMDTSSVRYLVSTISLSADDSIYAYYFDLGIDTTVTVYVVDTLEGIVELKVDSMFEQGADSAVAADTSISKVLRYASRGDVFADSLGGDAAWRLLKYSGGISGATPAVEYAPSFDSLVLGYSGGELTVIPSAEEGVYGMRGLLGVDELIRISTGQSVTVQEIFTPADDTLLFYVADETGDWIPYEPGTSVAFSSAGKSRIYVIGISLGSLVSAGSDWSSVVWGIPVIVD